MQKQTKKGKPVVMDATGKGDFDTTGRGTELGTLDNSAANPGANMGSLRPGSVPPGPGGEARPLGEDSIESLFAGEELTEEFKTRASVLFESAVNQKVDHIRETLLRESATLLETEVSQVVTELANKLDEYLSYVVEEWMHENKLAVENGIRTEVAESFMSGLRTLFETHYVDVPETKHDLLEDLFAENQKLEENLNEQIKNNMSLKNTLLETNAKSVFLEATSDLSRVDAERLATLTDSISFNDIEEFKNKITILKETYLKAAPVSGREPEVLTENKNITEPTTGPMSAYINAVTRQVKKP